MFNNLIFYRCVIAIGIYVRQLNDLRFRVAFQFLKEFRY